MLNLSFDLDAKSQKELEDMLKDIPPEIRDAMKKAILMFAGEIEAESTNNTGTGAPAVTGELRSRSFSELAKSDNEDDICSVVGFEKFGKLYGDENSDVKGKYYAIYVHEMKKNYTNGTYKFLENALKRRQNEFLPFMKDAYEKAMENMKK